jgi:FkbM family methyltransferase
MHLPRFARPPLARLFRSLPLRGRWRLAPWLNRLFPPGPIDVDLPGVGRARLDLEDEDQLQVYWTGLHPDDDRLIRLARACLPPDGVFLDVGANVGLHTLAAARHLGQGGGAVLAFEPHPENFRALTENLRRNGLRHVTAENLGLADAPATLTGRGPARGGNWSLGSRGEAAFPVRLVRLDDYLDEHPLPRLDVLKIDVEGAEVRVLRGAARTLERFRPIVLFEVCPAWLRRLGASTAELFEELEGHGYAVHALAGAGAWGGPVRAADLARLGPGDWANLAAVPPDRPASPAPQVRAGGRPCRPGRCSS